jgi:hypothetical protein
VGHQKGTGRPYLLINASQTAYLIGMSEADSDALLEELFSHLYAEDSIYEHKWQRGDLVVWDNRALNHARGKIVGGTRTLQRVTVAQLSYDQQYPADLPWFKDLQEGRGFDQRPNSELSST